MRQNAGANPWREQIQPSQPMVRPGQGSTNGVDPMQRRVSVEYHNGYDIAANFILVSTKSATNNGPGLSCATRNANVH